VYDREAMLASLERLEALERAGARIFFGHDLEFWQTVPQAPAAIMAIAPTSGPLRRDADRSPTD
jgi:glyoxylase-like metal-dependent hydrolase (beta-lactamase superfamily II)